MTLSTAKNIPQFEGAVQPYKVGQRVFVRGRGVAEVLGYGEETALGTTFRGITVYFPYEPGNGGRQIISEKHMWEKIRPLIEDKAEWMKLFALMSKETKGKKTSGAESLRRYDAIIKESDAYALAAALPEHKGFLGGADPVGHTHNYLDHAHKLLALLAMELSAATKQTFTDCQWHIRKVICDKLSRPEQIFDDAYVVTNEKPVKPQRQKRVSEAKPIETATKSIEDELNLELPIARAFHDMAFKTIDEASYRFITRRYFAQDFAVRLGFKNPVPPPKMTAVMQALTAAQRTEMKQLTVLSDKRYTKLLPAMSRVHDPAQLFNEMFREFVQGSGNLHVAIFVDLANRAIDRMAAGQPLSPKAPAPK